LIVLLLGSAPVYRAWIGIAADIVLLAALVRLLPWIW